MSSTTDSAEVTTYFSAQTRQAHREGQQLDRLMEKMIDQIQPGEPDAWAKWLQIVEADGEEENR